MNKKFHFWDMDHTVINNDCDVSWKEFMIFKGLAGPEARLEADRFYAQYLEMRLDVNAFLEFQLKEFKGQSIAQMRQLCQEHFDLLVRDKIYPQAARMIEAQIAAGEQVCLLTATNRMIAEPLAEHLQIEHILATELEVAGGVFTGKHSGVYCCAEGKIDHIYKYLAQNGGSIEQSCYYGDSSNDIVVLKAVGEAFAVNPGAELSQAALEHGWTVLTFNN